MLGAFRAHRSHYERRPVGLDPAVTRSCLSKEDAIEVMATVLEPLPNAMFNVGLKTSTRCCAYFSKMRKNFIRILPGDRWR